MTSNKELFKQAKSFISTLPRPITPSGKPLSTTEIVSRAFDNAQKALEAGNKRLVMQHIAFAIDATVNVVGINDLEIEKVFSQMPALNEVNKTLSALFKQEVAKTLEVLVLYGNNVHTLYGMATIGDSLANAMTKNERVYRMIYTAESDDDLFELFKCGGTYARMRIMLHLSTYEQELSKLHMDIFKNISTVEDLENTTKNYGEGVSHLYKLVGKASGGEQLTPKEAYNATAHIRNSVGSMFDDMYFVDGGLQSGQGFLNYASSPKNDVIEPIKSGTPRIFFLLNPIPDMSSLAAKPMVWGHALKKCEPEIEMTVVAPAMIPYFNE